jgi:mono/diheme cytochrome c family protein
VRSIYFSLTAVTVAAGLVACLTQQRPVAASSKASARGAETFNAHSCAKCHGVNGVNGDRAPDLQSLRNRMDAATIAKQIREGGKGMPPFGDQLSDKEVDDLVAYLRTKRKVIVPPPPAQPATNKDPDN